MHCRYGHIGHTGRIFDKREYIIDGTQTRSQLAKRQNLKDLNHYFYAVIFK